jgi:hypothetical protein
MLRTAVAVKNFHLLITSDIIKAGYPTYQSYQDLFAHENGHVKQDNLRGACTQSEEARLPRS